MGIHDTSADTSARSKREGTAVAPAELRSDSRTLGEDEFADRHGSGFLLVSPAPSDEPSGPASTQVNLVIDPERFRQAAAMVDSGRVRIYPVVRGARSVTSLINVGRTPNNDVVIPDLSVSRFHAFLKPLDDGSFRIQDAGSRNGTRVNGAPVPVQGEGASLDLKSGDRLQLGRVDLTFLDAPTLYQKLRSGEL